MSSGVIFPSVVLGTAGKPIVVLLAGFPDDSTSGWGVEMLESLGKDYRLLCLCLPGYSSSSSNDVQQQSRSSGKKAWGYDFGTLICGMHGTISAFLEEEGRSEASFALLVHDWGSYVGMLYQNAYPEKITRLITCDVGTMKRPLYLKHLFVILLYQWWFAFAYLVSQAMSFTIGNAIFLLFFVIVNPLGLGPCPHDVAPRNFSQVDVSFAYPYYHFWKGRLLGGGGGGAGGKSSLLLPRYPPNNIPVLFLYGKKKNAMFHDQSFLDKIVENTAKNGSKFIELDAGHWLMLQQREVVEKEIRDFLAM